MIKPDMQFSRLESRSRDVSRLKFQSLGLSLGLGLETLSLGLGLSLELFSLDYIEVNHSSGRKPNRM